MDNPGLIKDTDVAGLAGVSPQMCQFSFMVDAAATCLAASDRIWSAIDSASPRPKPERSCPGSTGLTLFPLLSSYSSSTSR